jgi:hypothetical protein
MGPFSKESCGCPQTLHSELAQSHLWASIFQGFPNSREKGFLGKWGFWARFQGTPVASIPERTLKI